MIKVSWLEKKGNHKYQLHIWSDGSKKFNKELLAEGFNPIEEGSTEYVGDVFECDNPYFEFGVSLYECFEKLLEDRLCVREMCLHFCSDGETAEINKGLAENGVDPGDALWALIQACGLDSVLYLCAANYGPQLIEDAERQMSVLDKKPFLDWLRDAVSPRFSSPVPTEYIKQFLTINPDHTIQYAAIYYAWSTGVRLPDEYEKWYLSNPSISAQDIISIMTPSDNDVTSDFIALRLFCWGEFCPILFELMNDKSVDYKVRRFIYDTLTDYCSTDIEFGQELQSKYNDYQKISGSVSMNFLAKVSTEGRIQQEVVDEAEYYKELKIQTTDSALDSLFKWLENEKYIKEYDKDKLIFRLTGNPKYKYLIAGEQIAWLGKCQELARFISDISSDTHRFIKTANFFRILQADGQYCDFDNKRASRDATDESKPSRLFHKKFAELLKTLKHFK